MILKSTDRLLVTILSSLGSPTIDVVAHWQDPQRDPDRTATRITALSTPTVVLTGPASGGLRAVPEFTIKSHYNSGANADVLALFSDGTTSYGIRQATLAPGDTLAYQKGQGYELSCVAFEGTNLAAIIAQALPAGTSLTDVLKQVFPEMLL